MPNIFKPDLGKCFIEKGISRDIGHYFYSVPIDHVSILDINLFSMSISYFMEGLEHAVTFDFDEYYLWEILKLAPPHIVDEFKEQLINVVAQPYTITFSSAFKIGIQAVLGESQSVEHEEFVQFNIKNIFTA